MGLAIRNTYSPDPRLKSHKLIDLHALPVCAPQLAARLLHPGDLAKETLIHIRSRKTGWPDWPPGGRRAGDEAEVASGI